MQEYSINMAKPNKYKILSLDLDGTTVSHGFDISDAVIDAISKARDKGVIIAINTGRTIECSEDAVKRLLQNNYKNTYRLACNGSIIHSLNTGAILRYNTMPFTSVVSCFAVARSLCLDVCFYSDNGFVHSESPGEKMQEVMAFEGPGVSRETARVSTDIPKYNYFRCIVTGDEENIKSMSNFISSVDKSFLSLVCVGSNWIEILCGGVNKWDGLSILCNKLMINYSDVISVGDGDNDLEMIKFSGVGVAMGNATKELKDAANFVTGTVEDNGVVTVIEKYILNQ